MPQKEQVFDQACRNGVIGIWDNLSHQGCVHAGRIHRWGCLGIAGLFGCTNAGCVC